MDEFEIWNTTEDHLVMTCLTLETAVRQMTSLNASHLVLELGQSYGIFKKGHQPMITRKKALENLSKQFPGSTREATQAAEAFLRRLEAVGANVEFAPEPPQWKSPIAHLQHANELLAEAFVGYNQNSKLDEARGELARAIIECGNLVDKQTSALRVISNDVSTALNNFGHHVALSQLGNIQSVIKGLAEDK